MKKLLPITLLIITTLLSSCMKDVIGPKATAAISSSGSYQPTSAGSTWKYVNQVTGMPDEQITVTTTGTPSIINNKTYYDFNSTSSVYGSETSYYYTNGTIYTFRGTSTVAGITVELEYLDNSLQVGGKWISKVNDTGTINGIAGRFEGVVAEKGISKTIGGKTFTDVIHTTINMQYDYGLGSGFETAATYDYYMAKGVGLIEIDYSVMGVLMGKESIVSYNIK